MDWIVDPRDEPSVAGFEADFARHLGSLAAVDSGVSEAVEQVTGAVRALGARAWVTLDWPSARAAVQVEPLPDHAATGAMRLGAGGSVSARSRGALPARSGREVTVALAVERALPRTYDGGPPPLARVDVDPRRDGIAAVAAGLVAVRETHPVADPPQTTSLAGALLAEVAAADRPPATLAEAAAAFAQAHRALGSDAEVLDPDGGRADVAEVVVSRCPLGPAIVGHPSACPLTTGMAGRLAAMAAGDASVLLESAIARGDDECHVKIWAGAAARGSAAERFVWPPVTSKAGAAPHLELSLLLPSESGSVPVVRRLAAQALRTFGVSDGDVDDVQLAISEACANVIDHAEATDTYEVRVEMAADRCALSVVDRGGGFDASAVPSDVEVTAEDGRGLSLMRALVDRLAFHNEPQAGAVVHMVKRLHYEPDHPLRDR